MCCMIFVRFMNGLRGTLQRRKIGRVRARTHRVLWNGASYHAPYGFDPPFGRGWPRTAAPTFGQCALWQPHPTTLARRAGVPKAAGKPRVLRVGSPAVTVATLHVGQLMPQFSNKCHSAVIPQSSYVAEITDGRLFFVRDLSVCMCGAAELHN